MSGLRRRRPPGSCAAHRLAAGLAAVAVLAACAGPRTQPAQPAPTIASLGPRAAPPLDDLPVNASLEQAISGYRDLLPHVEGTDLAPEILRRLGDLQIERGEVAEARSEGGAVEAMNASYARAESLYREVLARYPAAAQNEQIYYQLARVQEARGEGGAVLATLTALAARYPQSSRLDEIQFRRGELLFSAKEFPAAVDAYEVVIARGDSSPFYEQSLYKHGWALFKQFDYERGLDSFLTLLDRRFAGSADPRPVLQGLPRGERERVEDTLRAVSLTFSYQDGAASIREYFDPRASRAYLDFLYERLADYYLEQERYNDAAATFEDYARRNAGADQAPLFMVRVIDAYERGGFAARVLEAKTAFAERYDLGSDYWRARDPQSAPQVLSHLRTTMEELAQHYHAAAQRSGQPGDYDAAINWYRVYLRDFATTPRASQKNFLLAEALFESRRFAAAAAEYERTAYDYAAHDQAAEAGYAALLSYAAQIEQLAPAEAAALQAASIDSSLRFARSFPGHPQAPAVLTRASESLYAGGDLERAGQAAREVLEWPTPLAPALRRTAWTVSGHASFDQARFAAAEQAYAQARALTPPAQTHYADLSERLAASIYQQGEAAREAGDLRQAADHFLRVGAQVPASKIRATADYDAAAAFIGLADWARGIEVLQAFRQRYPEHALGDEVTRKLTVAYLESGQPRAAAGELERIASASTDPAERRGALLQAADLYQEAGAPAKTAAVLQAFVASFPRPVADSIEIRQRLLELSEAAGDERARRHWLQQIVAADAGAGAERSDRTRFLAARATLALAEPHLRDYRRARLSIPLQRSLARKKQSMEQALTAYGRAADYGIAEITTEATFQIADIYYEFSRALFDSERPRNLNAEELEQYEILLEEQAYPFEEQAIEVHEANAERVVEGLYDDWVRRSLQRLATLFPARYAKQEVAEAYVDALR